MFYLNVHQLPRSALRCVADDLGRALRKGASIELRSTTRGTQRRAFQGGVVNRAACGPCHSQLAFVSCRDRVGVGGQRTAISIASGIHGVDG